MIKDRRIEWRTFTKTPPLYLNKISCHDPSVFKSISTGVGYRLRLTNSSNETFKENVELYSRAMATSGYDYQNVKAEMLKFEKVDPVELAKRESSKGKNKKKGCTAYFISQFDPRLLHPRQIISRNYELLARSEKAKALFPRQNLVAASRRLKNLGEILSPTVQTDRQGLEPGEETSQRMDGQGGEGSQRGPGGGRSRGRGGGRGGAARMADIPHSRQDRAGPPAATNGSYHCLYYKKTGKCDVCSRMQERRSVISTHFAVNHMIAGNNVHLPATQTIKLKWFIYLEECVHPEGVFQYVGSTDSMTHRWANTKSKILSLVDGRSDKAGTGLENHFKNGCSGLRVLW